MPLERHGIQPHNVHRAPPPRGTRQFVVPQVRLNLPLEHFGRCKIRL